MKSYLEMTKAELENQAAQLKSQYEQICEKGLKLDMSRGKPGADQLDISDKMLTTVTTNEDCLASVDTRNYGGIDGLAEAKELFAKMLEVGSSQLILGGNSSLNMMYDTFMTAMVFGLGDKPWSKLDKVKFLCPSPGYDRHFGICQSVGIEMITVPMLDDGPDMDMVEKLVATDPAIKGIWCVPKYSNPDGITYSDKVVKRFASLKPAAPDFKIFWDNAYIVHDLFDDKDKLLNIIEECQKAGNPDMVLEFASTSKITFPGGGVAMLASSEKNIGYIKKIMFFQTIGPDKVNQLRHVKFFGDVSGVYAHMKKHADILRPKFETVLNVLDKEIAPLKIASWTAPKGGYFVSLNVLPGCAKYVHKLMSRAGVVMTGAGATFPYGNDPEDKNLRIAPTFPKIAELDEAMQVLCVCVKLAAVEKLLG